MNHLRWDIFENLTDLAPCLVVVETYEQNISRITREIRSAPSYMRGDYTENSDICIQTRMDYDPPVVVPPEMIVYPKGLNSALEGLAREIILSKPKDLYAFAADYFEKLMSIRKKTAVNGKYFEIEDIVKHQIKHGKYEDYSEAEYKEFHQSEGLEVQDNEEKCDSNQTIEVEKEKNLTKKLTYDLILPGEDHEEKEDENISDNKLDEEVNTNDTINTSNEEQQPTIADEESNIEETCLYDVDVRDGPDKEIKFFTDTVNEEDDNFDDIDSGSKNFIEHEASNISTEVLDDVNENLIRAESINLDSQNNQKSSHEGSKEDPNENFLNNESVKFELKNDIEVEKSFSKIESKDEEMSKEQVDEKVLEVEAVPLEANIEHENKENDDEKELEADKMLSETNTGSESKEENVPKNKSEDVELSNEKMDEKFQQSESINKISESITADEAIKDGEEKIIEIEMEPKLNEEVSNSEEPKKSTEKISQQKSVESNKSTDSPTESHNSSGEKITTEIVKTLEKITKVEEIIKTETITTKVIETNSNENKTSSESHTSQSPGEPTKENVSTEDKLKTSEGEEESNNFEEDYTKDDDKKPSLQKEISLQELTDIANIVQDLMISENVTSIDTQSDGSQPELEIDSAKISDAINTSTGAITSSIDDEKIAIEQPPEGVTKCDDSERCEKIDESFQQLMETCDDSDKHTSVIEVDENQLKLFEKASIMIQKIYRGFMVRSKLMKKEEKKSLEKNDASKLEVEPAIVSTLANESLSSVPEEKGGSSYSTDDESSTFSSAATKIQAGVRGFLTRKSFQRNKTNNSSDTTAPSIGEDSRSFEDSDDALSKMIIATTSIIIDQLEHFDKLEKRSSKGSITNFDSFDVGGEEKRKRFKREDAIQVHSPFSSGENPTPKQDNKSKEEYEKMSDLATNIILNIVTNNVVEEKPKKRKKWVPPETDYGIYIPLRDYSESVESEDYIPIPEIEPLKIEEIHDDPIPETRVVVPEVTKNLSVTSDDGDVITAPASARSNRSTQLRSPSSAEKDDKVSPLPGEHLEVKRSDSLLTVSSLGDPDKPEEAKGLIHSGEFHDMVLPTKVERRSNACQKDSTMNSQTEEDKCAAKIQAGVRGYLVRKHQKEASEAATKIQAGYRGFKVRKDLKSTKPVAT